MRKKSFLLSCVIIMCLFISSQVYASEIEKDTKVDAAVKGRVYKELLNNQITNEEDTIKVALEQYEERKKAATYKRDEVVDDSFSITQVVDKYVDENGDIIENARTTNLLVLDKSGNLVTPASAYSGSVGISEFQNFKFTLI